MQQDQHISIKAHRPSYIPAGLFLISLAALVAVLWPDVNRLVISWNNADYSYCFLLPFAFLYMLHAKEGATLWTHPARRSGNLAALGFFALGALSYVVGKIGAIITFTFLAIILFITGLFIAFYGLRFLWRNKLAFLVFFFCIPLPPFVTKILTFRLRLISTRIAETMMHMVNIPVFVDGNVIDLGIVQLQVVDACSGMRYFFPTIILALFILFILRSGPITSIILLALSPVLTVVANAFRLLVIALGVHYIDPDIVNTAFHEGSGIIVYIVAGLALMALHWLLSRLPLPGMRPAPKTEGAPTSPRLETPSTARLVLLALLSIGLSLGSQVYVNTAAKVEPVPPLKAFSQFPDKIGDWQLERRFTLSSEELASLGCDSYLNIIFTNKQTNNQINFLMTYYNEQRLSKTAHPPTSCLLGSGWLINNRKYMDHLDIPGFTFQQVLLEKRGVHLISNFWFIQRGDIISSEFKHRWRMLWDGVVNRKTYGALVRTEMPLKKGQTVQEGQELMNRFTSELIVQLKEYIP